jgi:hypothetical protein
LTAALEPSNVGRNWLMNVFINQASLHFGTKKHLYVGVVGGTKSEPEIRELSNFIPDLQISTLGIEDSDYFLDLNFGAINASGVQFDLIL